MCSFDKSSTNGTAVCSIRTSPYVTCCKYMQVHPLHTTIPCDNDGLNPDSIHGSPQNTYFFMPDRASWAILTQDASDPPPLLRPEQHCLPQKRDWRLRYCHSGKPPDSLIGYRLFLPSAVRLRLRCLGQCFSLADLELLQRDDGAQLVASDQSTVDYIVHCQAVVVESLQDPSASAQAKLRAYLPLIHIIHHALPNQPGDRRPHRP